MKHCSIPLHFDFWTAWLWGYSRADADADRVVRLSNDSAYKVVAFALSVRVLLLRCTVYMAYSRLSHGGDAHRGCQPLESSGPVVADKRAAVFVKKSSGGRT